MKTKKIIKLTEQDLIDTVLKVLKEQLGDDDNPLAAIKPAKDAIVQRLQKKPLQKRQQIGNPDITAKKQAVRQSLETLINSVGALVQASGINPNSNNLVGDLEKIQEKFENLFGDPVPDDDGGE